MHICIYGSHDENNAIVLPQRISQIDHVFLYISAEINLFWSDPIAPLPYGHNLEEAAISPKRGSVIDWLQASSCAQAIYTNSRHHTNSRH